MHILVVRNNSNPQAVDASLLLATYLGEQGIQAYVVDSAELGNDQGRAFIRTQLPEVLDMVIVLGGDGTVLHTVHLLGERECPVLPVNFGRLGFLANEDTDGLVPLVARALAGELPVERRSRLKVEVVCTGDADPYGDEEGAEAECDASESPIPAAPGDEPEGDRFGVNRAGLAGVRCFHALNEAALTRGALGRIIELTLNISGTPVANMRGDGIVVSTATGSTGYALSAGGPLVSPAFDGMIAVPIAPHTLRARAVLTNASDVIEVTAEDTEQFREATLFIDGELVLFPEPIRKLYLSIDPDPVRIMRTSEASFYEHLSSVFFAD
ncbi:NAD(+)/NADH kinase [uncultured Adlercreutzia sp.]|uniref:NAD(+)/NADH kinase n=1 Tax=uncultured Adlercreutzia sp. TaxID=875803 RepID=UPI0025E95F3B|nr:NAD(+)/NADH kinase [uncultured Adlercreutzia sp.]